MHYILIVWKYSRLFFPIMMLERTLASPLGCTEIKPVSPKGNQPWMFSGRIVAEAEAPIVWPPDAKSPLIGRDPDAGKDWGQEEKGATEDEMVRLHHRLTGHEFEQTPEASVLQSLGSQSETRHSDWTTTLDFAILQLFFMFCSVAPYQICQPALVPSLLDWYPSPGTWSLDLSSFPFLSRILNPDEPSPWNSAPASVCFQRLHPRPHSAPGKQTRQPE